MEDFLEEINVGDDETVVSPSDLLDGGHHFDNINRNLLCQIETRISDAGCSPCERLLQSVIDQDFHCPQPSWWDSK